MSDRPSMFDLNIPCDGCGKNLANIYVCSSCNDALRSQLAAEKEAREKVEAQAAVATGCVRRLAERGVDFGPDKNAAQLILQEDGGRSFIAFVEKERDALRARVEVLEGALREAKENIAYAVKHIGPDEWTDADNVLEATLVEISAALREVEPAKEESPPALKCHGCGFYCKMCEVLWPRQKCCCPDCDCGKQLAAEPAKAKEASMIFDEPGVCRAHKKLGFANCMCIPFTPEPKEEKEGGE